MKALAFENGSDVSLVKPAPASRLEDEAEDAWLARIAERSVPAGTAYVIVDEATLPHDRTTRAAWRIVDGAVVVDDQAAVAAVKVQLSKRIDADAERVRLRYISPGDGMQMVYREKFEQAQGVQAMGQDTANALSQASREAQFPTLSASVGSEAPTLWDCAQLVLQRYTQFAALSLQTERARLSGKKAVSESSSVAQAQAAYEAVAWPT